MFITTRNKEVSEIVDNSENLKRRKTILQRAMTVQKSNIGKNWDYIRDTTSIVSRDFDHHEYSTHQKLINEFKEKSWPGNRCFLVGGGPSLKGFDFSRLSNEFTIAINRAHEFIKDPSIIFFIDEDGFYNELVNGGFGWDALKKFNTSQSIKVVLNISGRRYGCDVYSVPISKNPEMTFDLKEGLYDGEDSGFAALNLAVCLGVKTIYLLGYDMEGDGKGNQAWFHDGYKQVGKERNYKDWIKHFEKIASLLERKKIKVINLNPDSVLKCFEFGKFEEIENLGKDHTYVAKDNLFFDGCLGFGDVFQERPLIKHFLKQYKTVYVKTPLPELFWDIPNVIFVRPPEILRTQNKHMESLPPETWSKVPPHTKRLGWSNYPPGGHLFPKTDAHPNEIIEPRPVNCVAKHIKNFAGIEDYDFSFPVRTAWVKAAKEFLGGLPVKWKKLCLIRPPTIRDEWYCPSRNPKIEYIQLLIDRYKDEYFFLSLADVDGKAERYDGILKGLDAEFHHGEVPLTTIFGLMKIADMSIIYPGFFMPLAIAIRSKCFCIFGGNAGPQVHIDPIMGIENFGWIAPEPFCQCINNTHNCNKDIPEEKIIAAFEELKNRPKKIKEVIFGFPPGIGDVHWPLLILESFKERHAIDRAIIKFWERWEYTSEFLKNIPFVDDVRKSSPLHFSFSLAGGTGQPLYKDKEGFDYMIEFGSKLEQGVLLEQIMPEYEVNWEYEICGLDKYDEFVSKLREETGGRLIVVYTSSAGGNHAWAKQDWTVQDWMTLINLIHKANGCKIVLVGARFDKDCAIELKALDKEGITIDLVGQTTIMQTLAIIRSANYFIGFSCGLELMACHFHVPCAEFWPIRGVSQGGVYGPGFMTSWLPPWSRNSDTYLPIPYGPESKPDLIFQKLRKFL